MLRVSPGCQADWENLTLWAPPQPARIVDARLRVVPGDLLRSEHAVVNGRLVQYAGEVGEVVVAPAHEEQLGTLPGGDLGFAGDLRLGVAVEVDGDVAPVADQHHVVPSSSTNERA